MEVAYLYKITNSVNEKIYIGVTKDPYQRFASHCSNKKKNSAISRAIKKYGRENFQLEILVKGNRDYILDLEEKVIDAYNTRVPNGAAVLTEPMARRILSELVSSRQLAKELNISEMTIQYFRAGKTYPNLFKKLSDEVGYDKESFKKQLLDNKKTTKLTEGIVREIRTGPRKPLAEIAEKYGVSISTASNILNFKTWKHVK